MITIKSITFTLILSLFSFLGYSQSEKRIDIKRVVPSKNQKALFVEFSVVKDGSFVAIDGTDVEVREEIGNDEQEMYIQRVGRIEDFGMGKGNQTARPETSEQEELTILFLLDRSGSMKKGDAFTLAKNAVRNVVKNLKLPQNTNLQLATFDDDISENKILKQETVDNILNGVNVSTKDTDLHRAIVQKIEGLRQEKGKKILVVLTDGKNDIKRNTWYNNPSNKPILAQEVLDNVAGQDSSLLIFPVGLGPNIDFGFLGNVADSSKSSEDAFKAASVPQDLNSLFADIVLEVASNNGMLVSSKNSFYTGNTRKLVVRWEGEEASYAYKLGTSTTPIDLEADDGQEGDLVEWAIFFFIGLIAVGLLFAILSIIIPIRKKNIFKKTFIKPYSKVKRTGIREIDPVTMKPFRDNEMVVVKCSKTLSLDTWKACGEQCPYYPDCIGEEGCKDGEGMGKESFFSQNKNYKQFNWIWFGAVGGMLGWTILTGLQFVDMAFHEDFWLNIVTQGKDFLAQLSLEFTDIRNSIISLSTDTIEGFGLGFGLGLALTYVEESGQSRKFSWGRVLFKSLIMGIVSYIIFALGFFLEQALGNAWIGGGIKAVLFGLILGFILSVKSTISASRGILGGVIAAAVGFSIYFLLSKQGVDIAKLAGFLLLGSILGWIIVSVVSTVEDFKLEYLEPEKYRATNPISKWLKSGIDIEIGKDPSCYVFIKWTDESVKPKHAKLSFDGKKVKIYPYEEVLINNQIIPLKKETILNNDDIIKLGQESITKMRYIEETSDNTSKPSNGRMVRGQGGLPKNLRKSTKNRPKPKIKISRRT